MPAGINRQFLLRRRPIGRISAADFDWAETAVPVPGPGEALVRLLYLSIDPTQRIWMEAMDQYMAPVALGEVMRGNGIARLDEQIVRWVIPAIDGSGCGVSP